MNKILIVALAIISLSLSTTASPQNLPTLISTPQNLQKAVTGGQASLDTPQHKPFVKTGDVIAWLARLAGIGISLNQCRQDTDLRKVITNVKNSLIQKAMFRRVPFNKLITDFSLNDDCDQAVEESIPFTAISRAVCFHYKIAFTMAVHLALYFYFSVWKKIEKRSRKKLIEQCKKLSSERQRLGAHKAFFAIVPVVLSVGICYLVKKKIDEIQLSRNIQDDIAIETLTPLFTAAVCEHICYLLYFLIEIAPVQGIAPTSSDSLYKNEIGM